MKAIPIAKAARMIARGTWSYITNRPLVISFEVTHSCNSDCLHCDKGGIKPGPLGDLKPEDYGRLTRQLKPMAVQLSGGEPLLRKDIEDIARAVKQPNTLPYLILVSNSRLLTEEKYERLRAAGIDQFSISLDFPDERHDAFRQTPGLFAHMSKLIPKLVGLGHNDVVLNTAITRGNVGVLRQNYEKAREWGTSISYSAYTPLRTGKPEHNITSTEDLARLRVAIDGLLELKEKNGHITNSPWTISGTYDFFEKGSIPGCSAGKRFMVVNPDGTFRPCSMFEPKYRSQKEILKTFVANNTCGGCYVSIRAYLDAGFFTLLKDNVRQRVFNRKSNGNGCAECH